jgi:hypothetical protein
MSIEQLHDLFETLVESLGLSVEPYRMYRPQGVNMEGYITFLHRTVDEFSTHQEAMWHYLHTVAQPLPHSIAPPRFTISSS